MNNSKLDECEVKMSSRPVRMHILRPSECYSGYGILFFFLLDDHERNGRIKTRILNFIECKLHESNHTGKCFGRVDFRTLRLDFPYDTSNRFQEWLLNLCIELESLEVDGQKIIECA